MKNSFYIFDNNLNVTEVLDSDFKNAFPGIFNFNVGILIISEISRLNKISRNRANWKFGSETDILSKSTLAASKKWRAKTTKLKTSKVN